MPALPFAAPLAGVALALGPALGAAPAAPEGTRPPPAAEVHVDPATAVGGPLMARSGLTVAAPDGVPDPPKVPSAAWLLADLDTGDVLAARAPHARLRPASTLKVLTALVLIPRIAPGRHYRVTKADVAVDGTRVGLVPGQRYTGRELFRGLLMSSGNDAARALSRLAGGRARTVAAMNAEAERLGALDTTAVDPSGLDAPGQRTSAYDLALVAREAMTLRPFRGYVRTKRASMPGYPVGRRHRAHRFAIGNHNALLYNYRGTLGVKNGWTSKARHTLVTVVRRKGHTYLVSQMYGSTASWRPTARLYDWAFRHGERLDPVGRLVSPGELARRRPASVTRPRSATAATARPVPTAAVTTADGGGGASAASPSPGASGTPAASGIPAAARDAAAAPGPLTLGAGAAAVLALGALLLRLRRRR